MNTNYDYTKDAIFESLLARSFEIEAGPEQELAVYYEPAYEGVGIAMPIFDEEDRDIVLHRDAHFAGSFPLMIEAYENEDISAVLPVETRRIKTLYHLEQSLEKNIAPFLLHAPDALKVNAVRKMYRLLQESSTPIADLILSEEEPEVVAKKTALHGESIASSLLSLLENELFYDTLFPGYGQAPIAAALTLGILKIEKAIPVLFSLLHTTEFEIESAALQALSMIGEKAKQFCIERLLARPLSTDNEKAALALSAFAIDDQIISALFQQLQDPLVLKRESLISYILASCEELPQSWLSKYSEIAMKTELGQKIKDEMQRQISSQKKAFSLSKQNNESPDTKPYT
jgi:hypothetical protein